MAEQIQCKKCGYTATLVSRFCSRCGTPLFVVLNGPDLKSEEFIDIFNSVFNLICDKTNPDRQHYFPSQTESVLWRRVRAIYEKFGSTAAFSLLGSELDPFSVKENERSKRSASNTLSGYSLRSAELLYTGKHSLPLPPTNRSSLVQRYYSEGNAALHEEFLYKDADLTDVLVRRTLFTEALLVFKEYPKYFLLENEQTRHWLDTFLRQACDLTLQLESDELTTMYKSRNTAQKIVARKRDEFVGDVVNDFYFGYSLKLSEDLMPY